MPTIDTNIIVRHLTGDNADQSPRARSVFEKLADGSLTATLREAVLVETVQVLSSRNLYNVPREKIRDDLNELIRMPGIRLRSKSLYHRALELYGAHTALSFVDVLLAAVAEREDGIVMSFDRTIDRVHSIRRIEP
ncbi:MAG: PIN domain-containing protein [Dehalococcoidia bacterium]